MKRWIHASISCDIKDLVNKIDLVIIANDAATLTLGNLPVVASSNDYLKDFDQFNVDEIMELSDRELRNLSSPYALDTLQEAINERGFEYNLTAKQKDILSKFYSNNVNALIHLDAGQIDQLIQMIANCKHVTGPDYRPGQPEKNFEEVHGLNMRRDDYLAIVKSLKADELVRVLKSKDKTRLGTPLYEFIHDPNEYQLKHDNKVLDSKIKIYIKLIINYENSYNIAIISFHDPDPQTLADLSE